MRICEDFKEFLTLIGTDFTDFNLGNVKVGKIRLFWADQLGTTDCTDYTDFLAADGCR